MKKKVKKPSTKKVVKKAALKRKPVKRAAVAKVAVPEKKRGRRKVANRLVRRLPAAAVYKIAPEVTTKLIGEFETLEGVFNNFATKFASLAYNADPKAGLEAMKISVDLIKRFKKIKPVLRETRQSLTPVEVS